jgi:alpha-N-acetylglucosamine transferase
MRWKSSITFWVVLMLLVAVVLLGWQLVVSYRQTVTAMFISHQCETAERIARDFSDPETIAHHTEFLICYYQRHSRTLEGTRLARLVRRAYEHTLTNLLMSYQQVSTNDFGAQIQEWSQKYAH